MKIGPTRYAAFLATLSLLIGFLAGLNFEKAKTLLSKPDQSVRLEYEKGYAKDKFGRLLAYVFVPNPPNLPDETFVNLELVKKRRHDSPISR